MSWWNPDSQWVTSKCLMELYFYSHVMMYSSQQWKFYKRLAVTGTGCKFSKINLYFTIFKCTSTTTSVSIRQRWPVSSMLTVVGTVVAGKWAIFARSRKKKRKKKKPGFTDGLGFPLLASVLLLRSGPSQCQRNIADWYSHTLDASIVLRFPLKNNKIVNHRPEQFSAFFFYCWFLSVSVVAIPLAYPSD